MGWQSVNTVSVVFALRRSRSVPAANEVLHLSSTFVRHVSAVEKACRSATGTGASPPFAHSAPDVSWNRERRLDFPRIAAAASHPTPRTGPFTFL